MNERIQLLVEQAFLAVGTTHDSITHRDQSVLDKNNTVTVYTFTQNTMNKIAELIVRECARVADTVEAWDIAPSGVIEKHFGVEE